MASITNYSFSGRSFGKEAPQLRSVSLPMGNQRKIINRRCASNESSSSAIKSQVQAQMSAPANKDHNKSKTTEERRQHQSQEDTLQDFNKWAKEQTIPLLPCCTSGPRMVLLPTRVTLHHVPLDIITQTIHDCLARLVTQGVSLTHMTPHPDHSGRIDVGCELASTSTVFGKPQLKFVIQLWKICTSTDINNDEPSSHYQDSVVVELIRRRGCPIMMHHLRRPLFTALQSLAVPQQNNCDGVKQLTGTADPCYPVAPAKVAPVLDGAATRSTTDRPFLFPPPLRISFSCL
jgi:hypothetical protein